MMADGAARGATIFAPATAPGRSAIAVVRISGPEAADILCALTGRAGPPRPRLATRAALRGPDGAPLDDGLVLWFPGPRSPTGEDVAELHLHGGRAVMSAVLAALGAWPGARPAEPGEFTRRAFEHGKLDLTQAEAIADLVDAETAGQRRQALRQLDGALGTLYEGWREALIEALAYLEAHLDFPDEDLPATLMDELAATVEPIGTAMAEHLADGARGERLREGFHVAVIGPPNAGKSSLINALSGRDIAMVSDRPGTTRDVIEVALELGGLPVVLSDTAGLRDAEDELEREGVRRALSRARRADLVLLLRDAAVQTADVWRDEVGGAPILCVANKVDLGFAEEPGEIAISARTGEGIDGLIAAIGTVASGALTGDGSPALTRARHRAALQEALTSLQRSCRAPTPELRAEDLRLAVRAIGRITGRVDVEDVLDVIFGAFCIGK